MTRIPILHIVDSLAIGGTENMAVSIANSLPQQQYESHLWATRADGPMAAKIAAHVHSVPFKRTGRFDVTTILNVVRYIRKHRIRLIHAHSSSIFPARLIAAFSPGIRVIWHDHYGLYAVRERPRWLYRTALAGISGVIAVNQPLVDWSCNALHVPKNRVWYLPNFVNISDYERLDTNRRQGKNILCIANLRPQKDPLTLIRAMRRVADRVPDAQLRIAGGTKDAAYLQMVQDEIARLGLAAHITLLGPQNNVLPLLQSSAIGVLSSVSEGLPVTLLEYGAARLAVVATHTGQIPEVLDEGRCGLIVPTESPDALADGLIALLESPEQRRDLGDRFYQRIVDVYSAGAAMRQLEAIYHAVGV